MDPLGRKKLENSLKIYKNASNKNTLKYLESHGINISDIKISCDNILYEKDPKTYSKVKKLENDTKFLKNFIDRYDLADRYKVPYTCISSYPDLVKSLSVNILVNPKNKHVRDLVKHMKKKADFLLKQNFPFVKILRRTEISRMFSDSSEIQLRRKFIEVISIMPIPVLEFVPYRQEAWNEFLSRAQRFNIAPEETVTLSKFVAYILSIIIKLNVTSNPDFISRMSMDSTTFVTDIQYIEGHLDISCFSRQLTKLWKYLTQFSIVDAVVCGDMQRVQDLIYFGFEIFPREERLNEINKTQVFARDERIILLLLDAIQLKNFKLTNNFFTIRQNCSFMFVLNGMLAYPSVAELRDAIVREYKYNFSHGIPESKCIEKKKYKMNLVKIYELNFKNIFSFL